MEKTVLVVVGNSLSALPCGQGIALELSQGGKTNKGGMVNSIPKSVWTCSVEAVSEYCRVILDLFPDQYQVRASEQSSVLVTGLNAVHPGLRSSSGRGEMSAHQLLER